jgi:hypothetical protein
MHVRIDDLLRLRDGEAVPAEVAAHVHGCARCTREQTELRERTAALRRVKAPLLPDRSWAAIRARLDSPAPERPVRGPVPTRWLATACAAALAGITGLQILDAPARLRGSDDPGRAGPDSELPRLVAESQQLEAMLAALPAGPEVVRARRVDAIRALEESIARVDRQLSLLAGSQIASRAQRPAPTASSDLWRRRVGLMQSLVQIRLADVRGTTL